MRISCDLAVTVQSGSGKIVVGLGDIYDIENGIYALKMALKSQGISIPGPERDT